MDNFRFDGVTQNWMEFKNNYWQIVTDHRVSLVLEQTVNKIDFTVDYNVQWRRGVLDQLSLYLSWDGKQPRDNAIPFKNGVIYLKDMSFKPHDKENCFTWQLPFDYSAMATCKPVQDWLLSAVKDPMQMGLLRAYLNAILTGRADLQRFLELIGPGGGGKGTFIRLAEAIIGKANVHVSDLRRLETNRFETAKLYGKRLCVITDAEKYTGEVNKLKAMTGCDSLPFEEKHKQDGQSFRFGGMVLIAANTDIATSDHTSGLQRRRITVRFENVVPPEERRDLDAEFEPYLPGVINWVLALPKAEVESLLLETERRVKALAGVSMMTLISNNPIAAWSHECLLYKANAATYVGNIDRDDKTKEIQNTDKLYPNYVKWTEATGRKAMAVNMFIPALRDLLCFQLKLAEVKHKRDRGGGHFKGIGIRNLSNDNDLSPLEQYFGKGVDEISVTGGDTTVTDGMTYQTRMVTKVTDFKENSSMKKPEEERPERSEKGGTNENGKRIGGKLPPQKPVTSITEPLNSVTSPSQIVTTSESPSPDADYF
jgi:putative DNA primase/helicase